MEIFRKKKVNSEKTEMVRNLNSMDLILMGLGSMVGFGIFSVIGLGVATISGPALIISIILAAAAVGVSAIIFAEFSSRIQMQGGPYGYLYVIFGEFTAWIVGWLMFSEFLLAIALFSSSWSSYFKGLFHLKLPAVINGATVVGKGFSVDLIAILLIAFTTSLVLLNARHVLRFNNALVVLKFSALALFIVVGLFHLNPANWHDFAPFGWGKLVGSEKGIFPGVSLIFLSFLGFETLSTAVDEAESPRRNIPTGILGSLIVSVLFYIMITLVLTGMTDFHGLDVPNALSYGLTKVGENWAAIYVAIVAVISMITICISMTYALSRVLYQISTDGLLPSALKKLSKKTNVPLNGTILIGVLGMILGGLFPLEILSEVLNLSTILYFIVLAIGIIKFRHDYGEPGPGQVKVPFVPVLPIAFIIVGILLLTHYSLFAWLLVVLSLIAAVIVYFAYGYKHSNLNKKRN